MSGLKGTDDELAGLKVSELKKLCKMNNLPTTGTKAELMGRILENKAVGCSFSVLPPEEEARLLGDDDDLEDVKAPGDQAPLSSITTCITTTTTNTDDYAVLEDLISSGLAQTESTNSLTAVGSTIDDGDRGDAIAPAKAVELMSSVVGEMQAAPADQVGKSAADILDDDDEDEGPTVVKLRAVPSDDERLTVRANRFGLPRTPHPMGDALTNDKLAARAKRFGLPIADAMGTTKAATTTTATSPSGRLSDEERLKRRAERFGSGSNGSPNKSAAGNSQQAAEEERKALRRQRFGDKTSMTTAGAGEDEQRKAARAVKFGIVTPPSSSSSDTTTAADKLSKRAARFGLVG